MIEALFFWALALYGAVSLTFQTVRRVQRRRQHPYPVTFILIVRNAEEQIEGLVRSLMARTALSSRERQVLVIDWASDDDTSAILHAMEKDFAFLRSVRVADDTEFLQALRNECMCDTRVGCIYDLRQGGLAADVTDDLAAMFQ